MGAALTLPDYNQVLRHLNGRLLPFGWGALPGGSRIDAVRVFALGVKPEYQHTGVAARFYQLHFDAAERTPQKGGEMGWILETNTPDEPRDAGHGWRRGTPLSRVRAHLVAASALHCADGGVPRGPGEPPQPPEETGQELVLVETVARHRAGPQQPTGARRRRPPRR